MSPRRIGTEIVRDAPCLREQDTVQVAVRAILSSGLPALPVVDTHGRLLGIFGERELLSALFPGYVDQLGSAGFVRNTLDPAIERRSACRAEPVGNYLNTEHVEVGVDHSDVEVVEMFLHHRVLILPVIKMGHVTGVITRSDFFRTIAERFIQGS